MEMEDKRPDWLKSLAEKTWNLELIISGAATYLTSFLPGYADQAQNWFLDNFVADIHADNFHMSLLAFSLLKVVANILPVAFVVHFVLRAFWASLVGLHTVYPEGIRYDNLHGMKKVTRKLNERKFGPLSEYILRLDRLCNQAFGMAFTIALFGVGMGMVYLFIFFGSLLSRASWAQGLQMVPIIVIFVLVTSMLVSQYILGKISEAERPRLYRVLSWLVLAPSQIMLPFIYTPFNYLNMVIASNSTKVAYYKKLVFLVFSVVIVASVGAGLMKSRLSNIQPPFALQSYWGKQDNRFNALNGAYADALSENAHLANMVLPSEMVTGPMMKVFVKYPKHMDMALQAHCPLPELPDSLRRSVRNYRLDSIKINCFAQHLHLTLNDSAFTTKDWVFQFHENSRTYGVITYLPTRNFKVGKNVLRASMASVAKVDSLVRIAEVPFWFGE